MRQEFSGNKLDNQKISGYNNLTELEADNKKPNPHRKPPFCGLIADILLADTYIITVGIAFVKIKF